ncbi:MAG TPA: replicative DNA helicase [Anaerolineae bacterium]|nr:replicative DNA helicase [Anaerolineae bacterium]
MAESSGIERLPPQNLEAEEAVLGALLIDPDAVIRLATILRPEDFYREKHAWIYDCILALHERREPVDFLTLCDELDRRGQLNEVGGTAFITSLISAVPTSIHAEHYARIVERASVRRRLIDAAGQIAVLAYQESEDVKEVVDRAEQILFGLAERRLAHDLVPIRQLVGEYYDRIEYLTLHQGEQIGIPTGFADLDHVLTGFQKSDMIILAARPSVGKTSLALTMALQAAKKHRQQVAFFSLEMSAEQVVQRLISAETGIESQRLRKGEINEDELALVMRVAADLGEIGFYIDDTPGLSAQELRSKARRQWSETGLDILIVDYLQLMRSDYRSENRVQEISSISRSLKALARELNVPLLALSQLSRSVESRQDKKPQLSDLRECLTGDALVVRADTGARVPIAELAASGQPVPVWALDENLQLRSATMERVFPSGTKPVFKLRTRSGRAVRASANHPFLKIDGWARLDNLVPGDFVAVPRLIPSPVQSHSWREAELILLAHLIGDGCFVERQPLHYTSQDPACLDAVESAATSFDVEPKRVRQETWTHLYLSARRHLTHGVRNPIAVWLADLGIYGQRSKEKALPSELFGLPAEQTSLFLRHLWATDGSLRWNESRNRAQIYYATSSSTLADGVRHLLLSLGINARVRLNPQRNGYTPQYSVLVDGREEQMRFLTEVGAFGRKADHVPVIMVHLLERRSNPNCDVIPKQAWPQVIDPARQAAGITWRGFAEKLKMQYCGSALFKTGIGRERMERIAEFLPSPEITRLARSDVYWDQIDSIESDGEEVVYDGIVPGPHNFVANDLIVHNSGALEQDADVVIFIYRDELYNPNTDRKNIADIIVAKHRNGPTGSVALYFKKELAQFREAEMRRTEFVSL